MNHVATIAAPAHALLTVPHDLEYTVDVHSGSYSAVRSWAHLQALASRVDALTWRWLIVQRRHDAGHRFAQCFASTESLVVEVGALDAATGRHALWRLHRGANGATSIDPRVFMGLTRDWLSLGVVPGFAATRVRLDGDDDEPF